MDASLAFLHKHIVEPIYALCQSRHNGTTATETDRIDTLFSEKLSNVTIVVDNIKLPAHRDVLVQRCQYFEALFNSGMIEATSKRIEVRETSIDGFKCVLKWIYTGTVEFTSLSLKTTSTGPASSIIQNIHVAGFKIFSSSRALSVSSIFMALLRDARWL
uniref:BTB domain-containing protein n=1 Tax=Panagrellus redivivus TaxID=6233 RepID=A0A7E4UTL0_PANRE